MKTEQYANSYNYDDDIKQLKVFNWPIPSGVKCGKFGEDVTCHGPTVPAPGLLCGELEVVEVGGQEEGR